MRKEGSDMRLPGESFCEDCPDREACWLGAPCNVIREVNQSRERNRIMVSFEEEIRGVINRHSKESPSNTPDYILAEFLNSTLKAYNEAVSKRAGRRGEPAVDVPVTPTLKAYNEAVSKRAGRRGEPETKKVSGIAQVDKD